MKQKNSGLSLIYILIISFIFTTISTSIVIYNQSKIKMFNNISRNYDFKNEVIKDLNRNEKILAKSVFDFDKLSKKLSTLFLSISDIKNIEILDDNSYFDTGLTKIEKGYILEHLIFNNGVSLGGYRIKYIDQTSKNILDIGLYKKIGDFEVLKKEKIKLLNNNKIVVKDLGFDGDVIG